MGAAASHIDGTGNQLIKAVKAGQVDLVTELISAHPALLRYQTLRHLNACHFAARADHVGVLQHLFSKAEEIEFMERLHGASKEHLDIVGQLANSRSDRGITPLMLAVERGCAESVKLLLEKGADPWAVDKLGGRTALHYAARRDSVELVQLLVEAAGEGGVVKFPNRPGTKYVDVRTQSGFTAVHFAVHHNSQQALAAMLNHGGHMMLSSLFDSLDCINCTKGTTPLHLAARNGNTAIAQQLLKAYTDHWHQRRMPDPRLVMDGDDQLPCQIAARRQHAQLARLLLPSTPLSTVMENIEGVLLGPPSLANIAAAVLRENLHAELTQAQQQLGVTPEQQQQTEPEAAADSMDVIFDMEEESDAEQLQHVEQPEQRDAKLPAATQQGPVAQLLRVHVVHEADTPECSSMLSRPSIISGSVASSSHSCDSSMLCGVCFDQAPQVTLAPCDHQLCLNCCKHLLALNSRCVLSCPFCRANVAHVGISAVIEV